MSNTTNETQKVVPLRCLYKGNRTQILLVNHESFGRCVQKSLLSFCDVEPERRALHRESELQNGYAVSGVVPILGCAGAPFYRSYVATETLSDTLGPKSNNPSLAISHQHTTHIALSLCRTLTTFHEAGRVPLEAETLPLTQTQLVHRDITPSNVYVSEDSQVLLSDFGLAYRPAIDSLEQDELLMGSPLYLAPELLLGQTPSEFTDIYQLGLLLAWLIEPQLRVIQTPQAPGLSLGQRLVQKQNWHQAARACLKKVGWDAALAERPSERPTARQFCAHLRA